MQLRRVALALAAAVALALAPAAASAGDAKAGSIDVKTVWAAPSRMVANGMGAFMILTNTGTENDKLVAASASIAPRATLHDHASGGHMTPLEGIEIPAGQSVVLKPGALHVMFIDLDPVPGEGSSFPLTLRFARAGETTVTVEVKGMPSMAPGMGSGGTPGGMKR